MNRNIDNRIDKPADARGSSLESPVHQAVWGRSVPVERFAPVDRTVPEDVARIMARSLGLVRAHREQGSLFDGHGKIAEPVLRELGTAGYWGLRIGKEYGGAGATFHDFVPFLTRMATIDPTVAALASVHGCIGAVDAVQTFGNEEQKQRLLPELAAGRRLSAFALTEPSAGSDLTELRTRAEQEGDHFLVNGEKLFVTNAAPGRMLGLVCQVNGRPEVLICELPDQEDEHFQLKSYGLWALRRARNHGIIFRDFRIPVANHLPCRRGSGLKIIYHGLNLGRMALCATAAGNLRRMMASMIPWTKYRVTRGRPIARRELVQRRLGRLAALVVGCDALAGWGCQLMDQGLRGEMECMVAKIFGSEALKEGAVELVMRTHGGRSFLEGHAFGDGVHDWLAPCIYEGENEMLALAFFWSLVKPHQRRFFPLIDRALRSRGGQTLGGSEPLRAAEGTCWPYLQWRVTAHLRSWSRPALPEMPKQLSRHAAWACRGLQASGLEISRTMDRCPRGAGDHQCRMAELSRRVQSQLVVLVTSLYASRQDDDLIHRAADVLGQDLSRRLTGDRPSDQYFHAVTSLGQAVVEGGFRPLADVAQDAILMPYASQ